MSDDATAELITAAIEASKQAYIPYSNYAVGAALRSTNGQIHTGCNVENASYPASICAERTALVKAVSEGCRSFDILVVATRDGGTPCGVCRQMLYEFSPDLRIILTDLAGTITLETSLKELLPHGFGPENLR